jgi:hypothetical protein
MYVFYDFGVLLRRAQSSVADVAAIREIKLEYRSIQISSRLNIDSENHTAIEACCFENKERHSCVFKF